MVEKLNRYKKITELSNHNFFGEKTVTKRLKLKKKFWTVCVACYNYFIDLNEGHTTRNVQKIADYQKNSKEFQSAFQDIFKTKSLDSNMRDMLEKFVEGYQRIKKLTKLTNDNISYTEFNITPSLQILAERINENYERIDNLTHMEYRLVDREATVLLHIESVNKIRQQKLESLFPLIFPSYSDCETLIESKTIKSSIEASQTIETQIKMLSTHLTHFTSSLTKQSSLIDDTKTDLLSLLKEQKFYEGGDLNLITDGLVGQYNIRVGNSLGDVKERVNDLRGIRERIYREEIL